MSESYPIQPSEPARRLGVLTYHTILNYGCSLQASATVFLAQTLGWDARVIDRWFLPSENCSTWDWPRLFSLRLLLATLTCRGSLGRVLRRRRGLRFAQRHLPRTPYHFVRWEDVHGRDLGLDAIVVGSDQVWCCRPLDDPETFFLKDAPTDIPAIANAVCIGMEAIPERWEPVFREGFKRFVAISVRDETSVRLANALGAGAVRVLDPTQLISAETWRTQFAVPPRRHGRKLVCYLLWWDPSDDFGRLAAFAKQMGCEVEVFCEVGALYRPLRKPADWINQFRQVLKRFRPHVHLRQSAGPAEFIGEIANADWVVTNSFHGLMFSSIFGKEVRVLPRRTEDTAGTGGSDKLRDFATHYVSGPVFAKDFDDALTSLSRGEHIAYDLGSLEADRERSRTWLCDALSKVANGQSYKKEHP